MEYSPASEGESRSVNKVISCVLRNPKDHYHVHKTSPLDPMLRQRIRATILTPYLYHTEISGYVDISLEANIAVIVKFVVLWLVTPCSFVGEH
jgi:hypothetical protein